ncbi:MAG TPA: TMEM175 family protein [Candidatus Angelobacter sp.]|jgi:uncharacterized membrane protein|nr:TMEM175 family protein [Candidatus Angelobacter sp.]
MESETTRIEFFSDAVFAIAITLLVLELKIPKPEEPLVPILFRQWPSYAAFLLSFVCIGVMWINHHRLFMLIKRADDTLRLLNLLLLLGVSAVPFPTAVLAEHLRGPDRRIAALIYNATFVFIAVAFRGLWRYATTHQLLHENAAVPVIFNVFNRYGVAPLLYFFCFIIAWFDARASVIANAAVAVLFAVAPALMQGRTQSSNP